MSLSQLCRILGRVVCLGILCIGGPALAEVNLGKIMPLGDSITVGDWTGGYRTPLGKALTAAGYTFKFVGSSTENSRADWGPWLIETGNEHHEGHSGFTITAIPGYRDGIDNNLAGYIGPDKENPDYILLMIGTNDIAGGRTEGAVDRLDALISHISNKTTGLRPNAHLIVASIPPIGENPGFSKTAHLDAPVFNAGVRAAVLAHQKLGENVTFLDMYSYLTVADLGADKLHPTSEGYNKIAGAWMDGIRAVPEPAAMSLLSLMGLAMWRGHGR